jgi:hypothetical protein
VPSSKPRPDGTLLKALARAWRWQRMLDDGVYASVSDIGDAENISKSYVSRILRLALLAPDIVNEILAGSTDQALMPDRLERPLPANRAEQRRNFLWLHGRMLTPRRAGFLLAGRHVGNLRQAHRGGHPIGRCAR